MTEDRFVVVTSLLLGVTGIRVVLCVIVILIVIAIVFVAVRGRLPSKTTATALTLRYQSLARTSARYCYRVFRLKSSRSCC
jgi:hypothetical protein